jgi:hypothetical protein
MTDAEGQSRTVARELVLRAVEKVYDDDEILLVLGMMAVQHAWSTNRPANQVGQNSARVKVIAAPTKGVRVDPNVAEPVDYEAHHFLIPGAQAFEQATDEKERDDKRSHVESIRKEQLSHQCNQCFLSK